MPAFVDLIPPLLQGAVVTVELTIMAGLLGLVLALIAGLMRLSHRQMIRTIGSIYVEVFRGSSAVVQIFFFFYILPLVGFSMPALATGILALGLNAGAYGAEIVRGAIVNVDRGQRDAAIALNMSTWLAMRQIILPQAIVAMLPPFGNLSIELLKGTSLVSLITLTELTFAGKILLRAEGRRDEIYVLVLILYFLLALPLIWGVRWGERRLSRGLHLGPTK